MKTQTVTTPLRKVSVNNTLTVFQPLDQDPKWGRWICHGWVGQSNTCKRTFLVDDFGGECTVALRVATQLHFTKHKDISDYEKGGTAQLVCDWTEPKSPVTVQCHFLFLLFTSLSSVLALILKFERMEEEIIIRREYFNKGRSYDVILDMLSTYHDIKMSRGTLKTRLKEECFVKCVFIR